MAEVERREMKMYQCPRCDGDGRIKEYGHIQSGICFKCSGTGKVNRKPSTPKARKRNPEVLAENNRKNAAAIELYKNDNRAGVEYGNPYFYMHAIELAKKDGVWDTL